MGTKCSKLTNDVLNAQNGKAALSFDKRSVSALDYAQALRPLTFAMVESFNNPKHSYANQTSGGIKVPSRNLWKEISTYSTVLPIHPDGSIFVRALEDELDKLRVLIIGPGGTPYANGCFFFDVHLHDYPNSPPKVKFLTTDNGKVRFNPNLYKCGKVCLSLLGTWSGPAWQPGKSTLLQVLVSLQGLVLGVSDPYFNEPGYDGKQGTPHHKEQSKKYNQGVRKETLQVAILPFLKHQVTPTESAKAMPFPEFKEVIQQHFLLKKAAMRMQMKEWLEVDKSMKSNSLYSEFFRVCDQLPWLGGKHTGMGCHPIVGAYAV